MRSTRGGGRRCSSTSCGALAEADGLQRRGARSRPQAQVESFRNVFRERPSGRGGEWDAFAAALDDDFNTPEALAILHGWRDHALLRRGLEIFGLGSLATVAAPPGGARARAAARRRPGAARTSTRRTGCRRDRGGRAGTCATWTRSPASSSCRSGDLELVYGRRPVREALRGPREVLELWVTERALKAEPWLGEAGVRASGQGGAGHVRGGRHAGSPGRARARRAVPLRRRVRARGRPGAAARRASTRSPTRAISAP